ncbi:hypothetical protein MMC17_005461 [Xylographa soralifera]|nr:hypothetical protein [Xylographa soralifera]
MIVNVGVDLFRHSKALKGIEDNNETKLAFRLRYRTDGITVLGSDLEEIGRLDTRSADTLKGLKEAVASIRCDVNVIRDLHNSGKNYKSSEIFKARLIIYGNEDEYDRVGSFLSEAEIFLQEPDNLISGVVYCNPHVYTTDKDNFMTPQFLLERVVDELDFQEAVEKIICTPEFPRPEAHFIQDHRLKTLLHRHQLTAVRFMRNREEEGFVDASLTLWQSSYSDGGRTYKHDITRESFNKPISECRGGLLMDEMGMGKSLSTLALIVHTLEKAELFEVFSQNIRSGRKRRRSTLIITTATTIQNWLSEIQSHIVTGSIRVHVYHGQSKKQGSLDNYDIVFTSYETAAAELRSGTSTLHQIEWFRVVLDEAHRVRNTATDNYRAVSGLHAERRWCLTGTPIHNGLNDLFSLTKFLQLYPFDRDSDIRKYITGPIQRRKQEGLDNLQSLIRVFALRRIKESKDYPDRHTRTILIDLTPTERLQYQLMRDNISVDLSKARECNALQSSQIILKGINRLMQFCSYGLASTDDHQVCEQLPNDSEHPSQAVQALRTMDLMTNSVRQYEETFNDAEYSHIYDKLDTLALLGQGLCTDWSKLTVSNDKPSLTQHANNNNRLDINGTYASYQLASKLSMVLLKLVELNQASSQSIKLPEKSLVFSFWKKPLKLLELALSRQKIGSVRIDGDCTLDQRDTALTKFKSDSDITVLLITFGIGSFGLNLTQASHVHIIDPQWNPMIEEQAAARVHRIGQTKPVFINRYIIANSVEEKIQNRQNRKRWFADISELKDTNKVAKEDLDDLIAIL